MKMNEQKEDSTRLGVCSTALLGGCRMSDEEQHIAIAEACGIQTVYWKAKYENHGGPSFSVHKTKAKADADYFNELGVEEFINLNALPDYLNDLNAMQLAEKKLVRNDSRFSVGSWAYYLSQLADVTAEQNPIDATAAQRAEAFLRTLGKWKEQPVRPTPSSAARRTTKNIMETKNVTQKGAELAAAAWLPPESAPLTGTMIIGDFGWPWPIPAVWDAYDKQWCVVTVQASPMQDGPDNYWLESDTETMTHLKRWMPFPDLPNDKISEPEAGAK